MIDQSAETDAPCHCWYDGPPCPRHNEDGSERAASVTSPGEPFARDDSGAAIAVTDEGGTVHIIPPGLTGED